MAKHKIVTTLPPYALKSEMEGEPKEALSEEKTVSVEDGLPTPTTIQYPLSDDKSLESKSNQPTSLKTEQHSLKEVKLPLQTTQKELSELKIRGQILQKELEEELDEMEREQKELDTLMTRTRKLKKEVEQFEENNKNGNIKKEKITPWFAGTIKNLFSIKTFLVLTTLDALAILGRIGEILWEHYENNLPITQEIFDNFLPTELLIASAVLTSLTLVVSLAFLCKHYSSKSAGAQPMAQQNVTPENASRKRKNVEVISHNEQSKKTKEAVSEFDRAMAEQRELDKDIERLLGPNKPGAIKIPIHQQFQDPSLHAVSRSNNKEEKEEKKLEAGSLTEDSQTFENNQSFENNG